MPTDVSPFPLLPPQTCFAACPPTPPIRRWSWSLPPAQRSSAPSLPPSASSPPCASRTSATAPAPAIPKDFPTSCASASANPTQATQARTDTVTVLETALDDLNPQILAHVTEQALQQGALDVMLTPVVMKKGRPGTLLTILCDADKVPALERLLLRETSTLGVRIHQEQRSCLNRSHHTVATPYGDIRIKVGSLAREELNATPEFEDCRAAAATHNVPVKQVIQAAIAAYHASKSK